MDEDDSDHDTTRSIERFSTSLSALGVDTCYVELRDQAHDKSAYLEEFRLATNQFSLWTIHTIAIPITYIYTGLLLSFPRAYIDYFPRNAGATDAQLSTILVVRSLPWTFKVVFGVLPDVFPVQNLRFKPYMLLGCVISSTFHFFLYLEGESPSVVTFTLLLLGAMVGIVMADVMSDALVANRVLLKQELYTGQTQSLVYMCRYLSEMIGYWLGAVLSNGSEWGFGLSMTQLFGFLSLTPLLTVLPFIWIMDEPLVINVSPIRQQLAVLWVMLQRRATWQPLCFLALVNACILHNSAWGNYLKVAYQFDAFQYGAMAAIGASVTFLAILIYRHYVLLHCTDAWHLIYALAGCVVAVFSIVNVLLVFNVNNMLGIPPFWFAVGDSAVISFARGFQCLPMAIMFVTVCPEGQEGIAFALLTSFTNLSLAFANTISNMLLRIWPVELPDLERHDYDGVWKLTVLTGVISLLPLLFITKLLPRDRKELENMKNDFSERWSLFILCLYIFGLLWVVVLSLLAVVLPCSVLVGGSGCS